MTSRLRHFDVTMAAAVERAEDAACRGLREWDGAPNSAPRTGRLDLLSVRLERVIVLTHGKYFSPRRRIPSIFRLRMLSPVDS